MPLSAVEAREEIIREIKQNIHQGNYSSALEYIEILSEQNPRDNEWRYFQFQCYLELGQYIQASNTVSYLIKYHPSSQHLMMLADLHLEMGRWSEVKKIAEKILEQDRRSIEAKILLIRYNQNFDYNQNVKKIFKQIESLNPYHSNYFRYYSDFLLKEKDFNNLQKVLSLYKKNYPENHHMLASFGRYELLRNNPKKAREYLERSLYYRPRDRDSLNTLWTIEEKLGNFESLIREFKKRDKTAKNDYLISWLYFRDFNKSLKNQSFKLKKNKLEAIDTHLSSALSLAPEYELARFFLEEFYLNNYSINSDERNNLSQFHFDKANKDLKFGRIDHAYHRSLRSLKLSPQNIEIREQYAEILKKLNKDLSYLEELKLIKNLKSKEDFALNTKIEKLDKKYKNYLTKRYKIDIYNIKPLRQKVILFLKPEGENSSFTSDDLYLLGEMVKSRLKSSKNFNLLIGPTSKQISFLGDNSADFYLTIHAKIKENITILTSIYQKDKRSLLKQLNQSYNGEDQFFYAVKDINDLIESTVVSKGQIIKRLEDERLLVRMGRENNVTLEQEFDLYRQNEVIASGKIIEVDDYLSLIKIDNSSDFKQIKQTDILIAK